MSPDLLLEEGCGLLGGEGERLEPGEFELIALDLVVFFQHAVIDGGLDVDDVAFAAGEGEVEEGLAGDRVDAGGDGEDLHGDVRLVGNLEEARGLVAADGGVGDAGKGVLVDYGVQLAGGVGRVRMCWRRVRASVWRWSSAGSVMPAARVISSM
jgi:hypothetical protein